MMQRIEIIPSRWFTIGFFCFSVALAFLGCKKSSKKSGGEESPVITIGSSVLEVRLEPTDGGVRARMEKVPEDATEVNCKVNTHDAVECRDGLLMNDLKDGAYKLTVTALRPTTPVIVVKEFTMQSGSFVEGATTATAGDEPIGTADVIFQIALAGVSKDFKNHSAVFRDKPLKFEFSLDTNQTCTPRYLCSQTPDIWALCHYENKPMIEFDARELAKGFQKLSVKAVCENLKLDSNILDVYWFGVEPGYQPLALDKTVANGVHMYLLAKQNDCLGELTYECSEPPSGSWSSCKNVKSNPAKGFQIRAICSHNGKTEKGPALVE